MKDIEGRAWVFGDDMNTDVIHPPQFYSLDPDIVRSGLFNGYDPNLQPSLRPGDMLVAGRNFGCGSSRETSVRSMQLNEVGAVVAVDFARIFFRSATNNALPCVTFADPADLERVTQGDSLTLSFADWRLRTGSGADIALEPAGSFVMSIWAAGGLLELLAVGDRR